MNYGGFNFIYGVFNLFLSLCTFKLSFGLIRGAKIQILSKSLTQVSIGLALISILAQLKFCVILALFSHFFYENNKFKI